METVPPAARRPLPAWLWAVLAAVLAALPLTPGLTGSRIFYIRDLSLFFWGRYLWLRRAWLAGDFPLWDPYVGGGQAAVADALHQMFLLPAVIVRLVGGEVLGFNLWVAVPFPLAACGAWLFLRRRFSPSASTLGAVAFALCGPIYSTSNFPNMSWTVAAIPWTLLAADRLTAAPAPRRLGVLAIVVALQAFAGEPVTLMATMLLVSAYAFVLGAPAAQMRLADRLRRCSWVAVGLMLGLVAAAVQLVPMANAAEASDRSHSMTDPLFWSLHPLALLETVAPHLFGDYYASQSLGEILWLPIVNSGREPFFFSLYVGVPLLALAVFGLVSGGPKRWTTFWSGAAAVALIGAFGAYTPIYPFLREHVPLLSALRFPAKYAVIAAMALAAAAAAGWDALVAHAAIPDDARRSHGRTAAIGLSALIGVVAYAAAGACLYFATPTAFRLHAIAQSLRSADPVGAAEFMLKSLPSHATTVFLLALVTAALIHLATGSRTLASGARTALYALIVADLVIRAWPINPVFDPGYLAEPAWLAKTTTDPNARFYIGGKRDGTLDSGDPDSSRGFLNPPGLRGSASRAALSGQTAFYPSAWHGREMLSYDLAVLWPRAYDVANKQFLRSGPSERDRFLKRTGVRFRIVPAALAGGRTPLVQMPYYVESYLYDWGPDAAHRATVVSRASVEPDLQRQLDALFAPDWDPDTVHLTHVPEAAGTTGLPLPPSAQIATEQSNALVVEASAGAPGGYLVLLDTFTDGWQATVDGRPAEIVRANALFRAVRVLPGHHRVEFVFRPPSVIWSAGVSTATVLLMLGLIAWPRPRAVGVEQHASLKAVDIVGA